MSTIFESGYIFKDKDADGDHHHHDNEDLMLAAELGKSLLERNRELDAALRATQEYAEEQCAQAEFYVKQVEILREENESSYHTCEQLEANNQNLSDKCERWKAECKILDGKNTRLWEVINSLEKRNEELTFERDNHQKGVAEMDNANEISSNKKECFERLLIADSMVVQMNETLENDFLCTSANEIEEKENLRKQISELNIQVKLIKLQKDEIECQLEDVVNENQLLYSKISTLNQEINEWENFAQKEENYRRTAAAFTLKHCIETDSDAGNIFEKKSQGTNVSLNNIKRSKSCECLNYKDENVDFLRSPNLVNNILSSINSSSFLSELDSEYSDLVKRYEALLAKYKQEGKLNGNPERTRKVQKAIQTLSLDFSNIPTLLSPSVSPTKEKTFHEITSETTSVRKLRSFSCGVQNGTSSTSRKSLFDKGFLHDEITPVSVSSVSCGNSIDNPADYRVMFSQIFAKLKESKVG